MVRVYILFYYSIYKCKFQYTNRRKSQKMQKFCTSSEEGEERGEKAVEVVKKLSIFCAESLANCKITRIIVSVRICVFDTYSKNRKE